MVDLPQHRPDGVLGGEAVPPQRPDRRLERARRRHAPVVGDRPPNQAPQQAGRVGPRHEGPERRGVQVYGPPAESQAQAARLGSYTYNSSSAWRDFGGRGVGSGIHSTCQIRRAWVLQHAKSPGDVHRPAEVGLLRCQVGRQIAPKGIASNVHRLANDVPDKVPEQVRPHVNGEPHLLLCNHQQDRKQGWLATHCSNCWMQ